MQIFFDKKIMIWIFFYKKNHDVKILKKIQKVFIIFFLLNLCPKFMSADALDLLVEHQMFAINYVVLGNWIKVRY